MTNQEQSAFDAQLAAVKRAQRNADHDALARGLLTRDDLARKNSLTHGLSFKLDLKSAKRLW
jgi:hypothetical protein